MKIKLGYLSLFVLYLTCANALADFNQLRFYKSEETLQAVREIISLQEKGVYLRFGDGDLNLAIGLSDSYQNGNGRLQHEMQEAFAMNGKNILKALPIHCAELGTLEEGMYPGNHASNMSLSMGLLKKASTYWGTTITDVYSPVALHYFSTSRTHLCIEFLRFLKSCTCILVGNQHIPQKIRTLLFGENCIFIPTPDKHAYNAIDSIEKEVLKAAKQVNGYKVIITSMGCSGRALQKRLWHKLDDMFLFDFGSLMDALCNWQTRAWITLTKFDAQRFLRLLNSNVDIISTAALINHQFNRRKQEYIDSISLLNKFGYVPYIAESCSKTEESFFNDLDSFVVYTKTNDAKLRNKGVNEAVSIKHALDHLNIPDNRMILKLTGRYYFNSDACIKTIEEHPEIDAFILQPKDGQTFSGCFAMRAHYLKHFLASINVVTMERRMINFELLLAQYVKKIEQEGARVMYLKQLGVSARIFGDTGHERIYHY